MKPSTQSNKTTSSNSKTKKSSKDREKRKSQGGSSEVNNHNVTEKGSPTKESNTRLYAGIDGDSLLNYAEQTTVEHLSEDITNALTEDLNYRLRYIINDSLIKARLSSRNAISSRDVEQSFENLNIDKVYGAPTHPNWIPFSDQNLYCIDDKQVNLIEIAEEENVYYQHSETIFSSKWIPEQKEVSKMLKNYFTTMCQMIVSSDVEVRRMALTNIGENCRIGPVTEWFYNFGYILLSKDITYDCLTLRALDLIKVLESSPTCRINVSEKQLKLLVRLILQRLLKSATTKEVLNPICNLLAILCQREPLKEFVILKILQKLNEVFQNYALPIVTVVNSLGIEAIGSIVLPHIQLFLTRIVQKQELQLTYSILESYYILCKENLLSATIYDAFLEHFGDAMMVFNKSLVCDKTKYIVKQENNFVHVKCDLLRSRRKVCARTNLTTNRISIDEVFDMPSANSKIRKKMDDQKRDNSDVISETNVIVGKTRLLLPVFKQKHRTFSICHDHTLQWYNL